MEVTTLGKTMGADDQAPVRILVVDDEPDVATLFRVRFRSEVRSGGLTILFAENGVRALEVLDGDPDIAVVITDLNMPEMDGLALLQRINAFDRPLRTIVLTAYNDMSNIRAAMRQGAFDFQVKPLDIDDLRATLAKAVQVVRELRAGNEARSMATALAERNEYLRDIFGRYVSDDVVDYLLESPDGPELRGERRDLTVLMADVRGFSVLSDELPPEQVVGALNSYLDTATEAILRRQGTINEILGDGLLVFFGAPIPDPVAAEHAVAAALELQLAMEDLNKAHRGQGFPEFTIGIGINSGEAIVGTIGSHKRMKYAAVGRNVNLAGRIEGHTVGGQILISDETYRHVADIVDISARFEGRAKGVGGPIVMHEVRGLGGDYQLHLTHEGAALRSLPGPVDVSSAIVSNSQIGDSHAAALVAVGPEKVRLTTELDVHPLEELVVWLGEGTMYGKVVERHAEGRRHAVTVLLTSVSRDARQVLASLAA